MFERGLMSKNIFILEDQTSCLNRLTRLLNTVITDNHIIVARDLAQAKKLDTSQCDMGFVDIGLPDGKSFDFIAQHLQKQPDIPIIVTTLYGDDESIFEAMSLGVSGYLLKADDDKLLLNSINNMLIGQVPISPYIAKQIMQKFAQPKTLPADEYGRKPKTEVADENAISRLSKREIDVLSLVGKGLLSKQVAYELEISVHRVNEIIKNIYKKTNVKNRFEAQKLAQEYHL